jgi:hypothetical protein
MQIRAAELTADNLNRTVRIDHEDQAFVLGCLALIEVIPATIRGCGDG